MNISERTKQLVELNNKYEEIINTVFIYAEEVEWPSVMGNGDGEAELCQLNEHMRKMLKAIIGASVVADAGDNDTEKQPLREDSKAA